MLDISYIGIFRKQIMSSHSPKHMHTQRNTHTQFSKTSFNPRHHCHFPRGFPCLVGMDNTNNVSKSENYLHRRDNRSVESKDYLNLNLNSVTRSSFK